MAFFDFMGTVFGFIIVLGVVGWVARFVFFDGKGGLSTPKRTASPYICNGTYSGKKPDPAGYRPGTGIPPGYHTHWSGEDTDACRFGPPAPAGPVMQPAACPKCHRNHFADKCPPRKGYRVTDGRTGEVVGHWTPAAERKTHA